MSAKGSRVLLVAGAVSYDYLVYPMTTSNAASDATSEDSSLVVRASAADLVAQLLTAAAPQWGSFEGQYMY